MEEFYEMFKESLNLAMENQAQLKKMRDAEGKQREEERTNEQA